MEENKIVDMPKVKKRPLQTYQWLPVTMKQFEELTNQFLLHFNEDVCKNEMGLDADYMAQILTSSIHALKTEDGKVHLGALFGACVKRISMHVTYHITSEIQKKLKGKEGVAAIATDSLAAAAQDQVLPDEVTGAISPEPPVVA